MMRPAFALVLACVLLAGCGLLPDTGGSFRTELVREDHSDIADPRARWEAYALTDYTIEQTRTCECAGPRWYETVVRDAEVTAVLDPERRTPIAEINPSWFMTVDDIFDMIETLRQSEPARFEVEYHPRYGYPTKINIDVDAQMVDEEIIMTLSNLKRVSE